MNSSKKYVEKELARRRSFERGLNRSEGVVSELMKPWHKASPEQFSKSLILKSPKE